jgi:hypothetical protein
MRETFTGHYLEQPLVEVAGQARILIRYFTKCFTYLIEGYLVEAGL